MFAAHMLCYNIRVEARRGVEYGVVELKTSNLILLVCLTVMKVS